MAYIGTKPTVGNFQICDAISVVNGQAAYTMQVGSVNVIPQSANHMIVSLNGTIQKPNSSFTVSGSTITFASNLATGDVIDFIQILGDVLDLGVPSDATVTAAKLNNDIISGTTALTSEPADTDEFLVSDAGTLKRIDYSLIKGSGKILQVVTQRISSAVTVSSQSDVTTGITKAITPTASNSSILVLITGTFSMSVSRATTFCGVNLIRTVGGSDTSIVGDSNNDNIANNVFGASNMQMQGTYAYSHKDSPGTTNEVTYTLKSRIETSGEAIVFNRGSMGSFITLMEIGA
jgi:hypothetical protein